ncbi:MAG TPA: hypothetical protein VGX91_11085 [Candidatus Cybelea sp.]|jgi:hypothetical protein|nr:hypothetical protein [Candidatus Cybelea sp.]
MTIAALAVLAGCRGGVAGGSLPAPAPDARVAASTPQARQWWRNDVGPRYQWNHNYGYCGEVSEISAGLYYGQYLSQYDARAAADGVPQNRSRSQLLLGVNALRAAAAMHLQAVAWKDGNDRDTDALLAWVKGQVLAGHPAIIGIYMNQYRFYGTRNRNAGAHEYDHIVPVIGIASDHPRDARGYFADDAIEFSDNGEWSASRQSARYDFRYSFGAFQRTRQQANAPRGPIYSISDDNEDFGIAILGVRDGDRETLPVAVQTSLNYEHPQIAQGWSRRPAPEPLQLTVTVSGLTRGVAYNLYRYDSLAAIPDRAFNAAASRASQHWTIDAKTSSFTLKQRIASDEVAAYRAVPVNAP